MRLISSGKWIRAPVKNPNFVRSYATSFPRINSQRLMDTLHSTCSQWGAAHAYGVDPTETGMARLALSDDDKYVRDWLVSELNSLGCNVSIDQMGNTFGVRPSSSGSTRLPTAMGSHLDTQPRGGRYDGILGIISALEALRTLSEHDIQTRFPIALVNWTNEEGARFPKSLHGSAVWSGDLVLEKAWSLSDVADETKTTKSELSRIGYLGSTTCSHEANPLGAHFELHIEQGTILESERKSVGVVLGAQGYKWFTVTVHGRDCHTGSTPYYARSDAMLCAAKIVAMASEIGKTYGGVASTGIFNILPGSINTCPSYASFTLDIRHPSASSLSLMADEIRATAERIATEESEKGCKLEWRTDFEGPVVEFDSRCVNTIRQAAESVVGKDKYRDIFSGAGHDSCSTSKRCPTGMIFVPSKDGLSHNPREYTSPEECAIGAQVLLESVLLYDQSRRA